MRAGSISAKPSAGALPAHIQHHLAPRINAQRMAVSAAAIFVLADLRRGDHIGAGLHRAGALQQVPMRLPGGHGEGGGYGNGIAFRLPQSFEQRGEANVVTNRQAQPANRRILGTPPLSSPGA